MTLSSSPTLPHNLDAEKTVIGCVLADSDVMVRIRPRLSATDFFDPVYRKIYQTCEKVFDAREPVDFVTVSGALADDNEINRIGGSAFLAEMPLSVPTVSHVDQYVNMVRDKSGHRALVDVGQKIAALGMDTAKPFSEVVSTAQNELLQVNQDQIQQSKQSLAQVTSTLYEMSTEAQHGGDAYEKHRFFTGFSNIDGFFDGLEPDSF